MRWLRAADQHEGLAGGLALLQKERDKREAHAQGTKDLRIKYITGIYEAELAQVEDEFQVRRAASALWEVSS
jgi:hypothetical protein